MTQICKGTVRHARLIDGYALPHSDKLEWSITTVAGETFVDSRKPVICLDGVAVDQPVQSHYLYVLRTMGCKPDIIFDGLECQIAYRLAGPMYRDPTRKIMTHVNIIGLTTEHIKAVIKAQLDKIKGMWS